ncbi:MAG: oxidoreductase [Gammaproteobacteria bacterium]|nr:oxidoreductase [Gammaproteobacteria bacterium]
MTGADGTPLIVAALLLPLAGAAIAFAMPRTTRWVGIATAVVLLAVVVMLCGAVGAGGELSHAVGGWGAPLGIALRVDGLSAAMLLTTAAVSLAVAAYGRSYFRDESAGPAGFTPLSMLLIAGLNALFVSGDLFNVYVTLEVLGLSAAALVARAGTPEALTGAMRYLLVTVAASLVYLLGVALLYHLTGTLDIRLVGARLESGAAAWSAVGLIGAAMLLKSAVFPLHFWLPPAHANAPAPVSALLSALVVKASLYVLLRVWLDVLPAARADFGAVVGALGCAAVLWGSTQALRQDQLKLLVAYSTVAQVGYLFIPFAFTSAAAAGTAWRGAVYLVLCHALAKTAMFMSVGNIQLFGGDRIGELDRVVQRLPLTMAAFAVAGITVAGLPPSGGFVAKWLILEAAVQEGRWFVSAVVLVGGLLASIYVFRVIGPAFTKGAQPRQPRRVPNAMEWVAFAVALATVLLGFFGMPLLELIDAGAPFGNALEPER